MQTGPSEEDLARIAEALCTGKRGLKIGGHFYPAAPTGTSQCLNDCGCWLGPSRSGGPEDVDPFGACPMAPGPV